MSPVEKLIAIVEDTNPKIRIESRAINSEWQAVRNMARVALEIQTEWQAARDLLERFINKYCTSCDAIGVETTNGLCDACAADHDTRD